MGAQNAEQLLGQHHIPILAALAAEDVYDHAPAVDIFARERNRFGHAQSGPIDRHKGGSELQVAHSFGKTFDFIARQNGRQGVIRAERPLRDRPALQAALEAWRNGRSIAPRRLPTAWPSQVVDHGCHSGEIC